MSSLATAPRTGWASGRVRDAYRALVTDRDGWRCHYCAAPLGRRGRRRLTLDHVWPVAFGRIDAVWNLVPACGDCNSRRGHDTTWCACARCVLALRLGRVLAGGAAGAP